jgi:hypothetical protein
MEEEDRIVFRDGLLDGFDHLVELKLVVRVETAGVLSPGDNR